MVRVLLNPEKYKATVLYLLNAMGSIVGKKKAYKLMYFLDFDFYEAYEKSFTGETYKALPMGPAPVYFDSVIESLVEENLISIKKERKSPLHENDTITYLPKKEMSYQFSKEEEKMLKRVITTYGSLTGKQLEDLSHSQYPYAVVSLNDVIPYELAFYRDTPHLTD